MYELSTDLNEASQQIIRKPSHLRVFFGIIDPNAVENSTITTNGEMLYSDANAIDIVSNKTQFPYSRTYENGIILDGGIYCMSPDNLLYQGYASSAISKVDNTFSTNPILTFAFDAYINLRGLTFTFVKRNNNYPTLMTIRLYDDTTLLETFTDVEVDNIEFVFEQNMPSSGYFNKMQVEFTKTRYPRRDVLLQNIVFGVYKTLDGDVITTCTLTRSVDLINGSQPIETLNFTIIDPDRLYDPENPSGVWEYMDSEQPIFAELGYEIADGSTEYIPMCSYYTTGAATVENGEIPQVSFSAVSLLGHLANDYLYGIYNSAGVTLYELAESVMESLNLQLNEDGSKKWDFDYDVLSQFRTYTPLSVLPVRDCLQLIASAGGCVLSTNRYGNIEIKKVNYSVAEDFSFTKDNIFSLPKITKYPQVKDVVVGYSLISVSDELKTLVDEDISSTSDYSLVLSYNLSTNHSYATTGTLSIVGTPAFYASVCEITVKGTGTLTITGNEIISDSNTYRKNYNNAGDDCPVTMELINSLSHASQYADYIYDYVKLRNVYNVEDRGFIELDPLDIVSADTGYDYTDIVLTNCSLTYNGALRGSTEYYQLVKD